MRGTQPFAGGWDRIRESGLGLASTSAVLDHYGVTGERRERLECQLRPEAEWVERDGMPPALIRDQKPLVPARSLERVLEPDITVREWCIELNRRVYFFVTVKPLERLLAAYADVEHDVLVVDARKLADRYQQSITLSAINTGAIGRAHKKRGRGTFVAISQYPTRPGGGPLKPVAEITVSEPIVDIEDITVRVERWLGPTSTGVPVEPKRLSRALTDIEGRRAGDQKVLWIDEAEQRLAERKTSQAGSTTP